MLGGRLAEPFRRRKTMKKLLTILILACTIGFSVFAQDKNVETDKSQVEQVMLKKGSLILKEFIPFKTESEITGEILKVTDVTNGSSLYGLRLTHFYYNSKYDSGESTGLLDAKEIDSVIATLEYVSKTLPTFTNETPYTEIVYKSNSGITIGAYHSDGKQKIFLKFNYKDTVYISASSLDSFTNFFKDAKTKMQGMGVKF